MKFALFAGDDYYPSGGWCDFVMSGTLEECRSKIRVNKTKNPRYHKNDKRYVGPEFYLSSYRLLETGQEILVDWWHIVDLDKCERVLDHTMLENE